MEPSATPPWRVLEDQGAEPERHTTGPGSAPSATASQVAIAKLVAIGGAAIVCAVAAIVLALGSGEGTVRLDGGSPLAVSTADASVAGAVATGGEVVVEIVGAVAAPGVYTLPGGSRLADLVRLAGGYGPRVDTARAEQELNLAAPLRDGDHIRVPSRDDADAAVPSGAASTNGTAGGGPVDLNRASQAELEELPGIGPATATKIIAAREEAPFTAVEELQSRGVLGEKTFEKLRDLVTVG
jgi:competence protein ComEA